MAKRALLTDEGSKRKIERYNFIMGTKMSEKPKSGYRYGPFSRLLSDKKGVAAIEFAIIAPILFILYFLTMETSQAIDVNKRVSRIASEAADLATQQQSLTKSQVDAILEIGESVIQPYNRSEPTITMTGIQITDDATPQVLVAWSRKLQAGATSVGDAVGTTTTVPDKLKIGGTFLVRVEADLAYKPVLTWTAGQKASLGSHNIRVWLNDISMGETYYLRPRLSSSIDCADCNS